MVTDGNITTAMGNHFVELSLELQIVLGIFKNKEEEDNDRRYWLESRNW